MDNEGYFEDHEMENPYDFSKYTDEQINEEIDGSIRERNMLNEGGEVASNKRVRFNKIVNKINKLEERNRRGSQRVGETSFIDSSDGRTVMIRGTKFPKVPSGIDIVAKMRNEKAMLIVDKFIKDLYGDKKLDHRGYTKMYDRVGISKDGSLTFKPTNANDVPLKEEIVLKPRSGKRDRKKYSETKTAENAVKQFRELIEENIIDITSNTGDREEFSVIDTKVCHNDNIPGLSPDVNREHRGSLNSPLGMLSESRIGDKGALQIQADHFQKVINEVDKRSAKLVDKEDREGLTDDKELEYFELQERRLGLEQARDETLEQRELEETRELQEDIDRYERFKRWAKENMYSKVKRW